MDEMLLELDQSLSRGRQRPSVSFVSAPRRDADGVVVEGKRRKRGPPTKRANIGCERVEWKEDGQSCFIQEGNNLSDACKMLISVSGDFNLNLH